MFGLTVEQAALTATTLLTGALVLATAWIAIATLRGVATQMHVTTFAEYTRRYAEISERLPANFSSPTCGLTPSEIPEYQREHLLRGMRRYFNLCWEELHLQRSGKIDKETWSIWKAGIQDTLRSPCVRACWSLLRSEYDYGGLGREFVRFIDEARDASPTAVHPVAIATRAVTEEATSKPPA